MARKMIIPRVEEEVTGNEIAGAEMISRAALAKELLAAALRLLRIELV